MQVLLDDKMSNSWQVPWFFRFELRRKRAKILLP
jgi:hypothetical protein